MKAEEFDGTKTDLLLRAYERERQAAARLRVLEEMRQSLLTGLAHHVRTPVTVILGALEVLERSEDRLSPDVRREFLERISLNVERLGSLLTDLLDSTELEQIVLASERAPLDVCVAINEAIDESPADDGRTIHRPAERTEARVAPLAVKRIVRHLLDNAARYSAPGSPIWVGVTRIEGGIEIVVDDTGPGISDNLKRAIFEPFRQGSGVAEHSPGVGLGLSTVTRLAAMHAGQAWVEDRPGGGSSFRVTLLDEIVAEAPERSEIAHLLRLARKHLDMDLAFLGELTEEGEVFRSVDAENDKRGPMIREGDVLPVGESYCERMVTGRISNVVSNSAAHPVVSKLAVTTDAGIGSYVGVPVVLSDGQVYGTLCCVSTGPKQLVPKDAGFLRMLSVLVAEALER